MTMLQTVRTYSRMIAKGSLYIGGGLALGYPLLKGAQKLMDGSTLEDAGDHVIWEATGYDPKVGRVIGSKMKEVAIRDIAGGAAIFVAAKL